MGLGGLQDGVDDGGDGDGGHTAEVDGAGAAEAGRAGRVCGEDVVPSVAGQSGGGEFGRGAAEGDDDRGAQGGSDVHGAGVIGQENTR